jgi:hypothetical protein
MTVKLVVKPQTSAAAPMAELLCKRIVHQGP